MKIIHISDIHISDKGLPIWGTDTLAHFKTVIDVISQYNDIDAIVISGDIADNGCEWAYNYVDKEFAKIGIPTYVCPGNHDWLPTMRNSLSFCQVTPLIELKDWKFLFLNSTMIDDEEPSKYRARGTITSNDYNRISEVANDSDKLICIILHHSPIEPGQWMNRKLLEDREKFRSHVGSYDSIRLILFGHIHYALTSKLGHILYSSAPSVGFAFDPYLNKYEIADGSEGFNIIEIDNEGVINISTITMPFKQSM